MTVEETPQLSMDLVLQDIDKISDCVDSALSDTNREQIFGADIAPFFKSRTGLRVPAKAVVRLALFSDCLRVVDIALRADGRISAEEIDFVQPLVYPAMRFYMRLRDRYQPYFGLAEETIESFLEAVRTDPDPFGHACEATDWIGLDICHRVAVSTGDTAAREIYQSMALRLMNEIIALGGVSHAEAREQAKLARFFELRKKMQASLATAVDTEDPRVRGFCSPYSPRVFTPTQHANQIWEYDPYDVEWVHEPARTVFARLLDRIDGPIPSEHGHILLMLGESGSGKTHLLRAFRNHVHSHHLGFVGYLQVSTHTNNYADHVLCKLIDSLERPYDPFDRESSGLSRLSNGLAEQPGVLSAEQLTRLRDGEFEPVGALHAYVRQLADIIISTPGNKKLALDVIRALLYLQRDDPIIRARVLAYLRCEPMSAHDRQVIGDMAPHGHGRDAPLRTLEQIGRIVWVTGNGALVLMLDQMEDIIQRDQSPARLHDVLSVVRQLIDQIPTLVVVLSCLTNVYESMKKHLTRSTLDRIEQAPPPVRLNGNRGYEEIEALVERRVAHLYDTLYIHRREGDELFPFRADELQTFINWRTRDVLDWCHDYHEQCITAGRLVARVVAPVPGIDPSASAIQAGSSAESLERAWVEFTAQRTHSPPDEASELLSLLSWAMNQCASELEPGYHLTTTPEGDCLAVEAPARDSSMEPLLVGMCQRGAQRGALEKQLIELQRAAGDRCPVAVRSAPFPKSGKTAKRLGLFLRQRGRAVVVENTDWRRIMALREFLGERPADAGLDAWRRTSKPLTQLKALRDLLVLDDRKPIDVSAPHEQPVAPPTPNERPSTDKLSDKLSNKLSKTSEMRAPSRAPEPRVRDARRPVLHLGRTIGLEPDAVDMPLGALSRHAAFLGSSGSGKTTLALNIVEQLLTARVPVIMIDRKGDLAGYARWAADINTDGAGGSAGDDPRRIALLTGLEVALYTPGDPGGRPLAIPVVPSGMADMSPHDRTKVARYAASALAAMMKYKESVGHRARLGILSKAIALLAQTRSGSTATLEDLIKIIDNQDPALVAAIGRLDAKHFSKLVEDLTVLQINRGELLAASGEHLDPAALFGRGQTAGKPTRLSIISTKFLGDTAKVQFWVARLLIELSRWASAHPSSQLQAAVLLDEADMYLPAQSKPATKEPLQDLLKRARSAGIGVLLATQSPGDLDYRARDNISTWFVGKIAETRAIAKMKPLLSECRTSIEKQLPVQRVGQFAMLQGGHVTRFESARSLLDTEQLAEHEIRALARRDPHAQTVTQESPHPPE